MSTVSLRVICDAAAGGNLSPKMANQNLTPPVLTMPPAASLFLTVRRRGQLRGSGFRSTSDPEPFLALGRPAAAPRRRELRFRSRGQRDGYPTSLARMSLNQLSLRISRFRSGHSDVNLSQALAGECAGKAQLADVKANHMSAPGSKSGGKAMTMVFLKALA
jgi:hypothetical protein